MSFDYSKLKGRIIEKYGTQGNFAEEMDMSQRTLSLKLNSTISWRNDDISKACELLDISKTDIPKYFFEVKVQKD